jgi:hypothetical protein
VTDRDLDLGHGHVLHWASWEPDRQLNPQYAGVPDIEKALALIRHPLLPGDDHPHCRERGYCEGALHPDTPEVRRVFCPRVTWQVLSWEPLTLDPSIRCHCGDHGWVREGRWVQAG